MCTASWLIRSDGFELFFNRDEARSRLEARPPEPLVVDGVRCLAPVDADAGGTWIGVNEHGLALAILNAWEDTAVTELLPISRGELVRSLLSAPTHDELEGRLIARDLRAFRGFRLAVFAPGSEPRIHAWLGGALRCELAALPLASSSCGAERAHVARREVLQEIAVGREPGAADLELFHGSHAPERGAWSPCMHRTDASTVSATHVRVGRDEVGMRYAPGPPCRTSFGPLQRLARREPAGSSG